MGPGDARNRASFTLSIVLVLDDGRNSFIEVVSGSQ